MVPTGRCCRVPVASSGRVAECQAEPVSVTGAQATPSPDDPRRGAPARGRQGAIEALEVELSRLFRRARSQSARTAEEVHPDLDASGYALLRVLYAMDPAGAGIRAVDLTAALALHKSTTSRAVADLERLGLLIRLPDPADARARLITLTESGRAALDRSRQARRAAMAQALAPWTVGELRDLAALLGRFNELGPDA